MKRYYILILAIAILLPGCQKEALDGGLITVEASVGPATKVTCDGDKSSFAAGDKISVYAWTGSASEVPAKRVVDGVVNTYDGSAWTPASLMRWRNGSDAHYFLGVSPVHAISDFMADSYSVDPADYTASDLLIARNLDGVKSGDGAVKLDFRHAMAKLKVNLSFRDQFGGTPVVSAVSLSAKTKASINYLTQAVSATGDAASVSLPAVTANSSYSGLMVPQTGVKKITVTIDGKDYVYEAGEDIPLTSGQVTTVNLTVGRDRIELASAITIADWVDEKLPEDQEVVRDFSREPLTFEAWEAGAKVSFTLISDVSGVQYSTDGSTWMDYSSGTAITLTNVGDCVMFRGDNAGYALADGHSSHFSCSAACSVYGNIMSLVSSTDFATATALTANYAFHELFRNNTNLRSDASKFLVLPATVLTDYCYCFMFGDCTSLTIAPALPATTLANDCYNAMFCGCTNLTAAPTLPATTLAESCYFFMFYGCKSLTTAPELPATTLTLECYHAMFECCSNLTTAPELPATALAEKCYLYMFDGCESLTTAPKLPATTLAEECYDSMFWGCKNLTTAPELPATTLAEGCYQRMFWDCSSLNSITCAATDITAKDCTNDWLKGVATTGTFTTPDETAWTLDSESGIPANWTRVNL